MKYPFRDDYAVRVWSEEGEADIPEVLVVRPQMAYIVQ